ncbi:MAG: TRAP transporter permease [Clostridiales bacterium]|nr:TRAP transporter permease [Clostridiales bacterium]
MNKETTDRVIDSNELLREFDIEARFRKIGRESKTGMFIFLVCVAFALFHLYTSAFGPLNTLVHRAVHTAVVMALVFLLYPHSKKYMETKPLIADWIFAALSIAMGLYILVFFKDIVMRAGMPNTMDIAFGLMTILLVLEAGRRVVGKEVAILAIIFMIYAYFGRSIPGIMAHRGYSLYAIAEYMYVTTEGIFGIAIGVSSTYIILFILFGAFLAKSGMGQFFNDLAMAIAGGGSGGPAKVAVVSSGLLGSINGSAVANVVTTGAFTIPLMKKIGYSKEFAGAVEGTASVGGQILPPVMGAAAFIMAESLGIKYITIVAAAVIPAFLYYLGLIVMIHLRAKKDGLVGLPKDQLPKIKKVLKERGHLILPIFILLYLLVQGFTPLFSAFYSIIATIAVSALRKNTRMSFNDIIDALEDGTRTVLGVAMACAVVGLIIGVATLTGFGLKLASVILMVGQGSLLMTLVFTMLACIVLGMGLPSIPAYIITATMAAPALAQMGIPLLVSHMFVFYFGMLANLTPPVALAAFAGAGIAGGNTTKTGIQAMKLALAGFIVPYMFVYSPALLLIDATTMQIIIAAVTAAIGVVSLGAAVEGYLIATIRPIYRIALIIAALTLMHASLLTDAVGIAIIIVVLMTQKIATRKEIEVA